MVRYTFALILLLSAANGFTVTVGVPQREYRGQTYLIQPCYYYGPAWYAGDGVFVSPDKPSGRTSTKQSRVRGSLMPPPCAY